MATKASTNSTDLDIYKLLEEVFNEGHHMGEGFKRDPRWMVSDFLYAKKLEIERHTLAIQTEARKDELEKVKLVTYREEMVRYADKRLAELTTKSEGSK